MYLFFFGNLEDFDVNKLSINSGSLLQSVTFNSKVSMGKRLTIKYLFHQQPKILINYVISVSH